MKNMNVENLTMTLANGQTLLLGSVTWNCGFKSHELAIAKASEAFQKLATATARVTLKPVDSSSEQILIKAFRAELQDLLIEAEKQKPPMWAKKWKGQRS